MRALVLLLLITPAVAGVTLTEVVGRYEARNAAGVMIGGLHDTLAACIAVLPPPTAPGKTRLGTCKLVYHIDGELNCDGSVKPELTTFIVLDANALVYAGPWCAPGETCTTPADWDEAGTPTPEGRVYTFTDIGGLRFNDDGTTDEYKLVLSPPPACWEWKWEPQGEPVALRDADGNLFASTAADWFVPELDPGALDDNGSGDPTWPGYVPPVNP